MRLLLLLLGFWSVTCHAQSAVPAAGPPPVISGVLEPASVAIVINENDPASVEIGAYYQARRRIPPENVVRVRFPAGVSALERAAFETVFREVQRATPAGVQAYALAWTRPYRVGCVGITSAFAFGADESACAASCSATPQNPYFDSPGAQPWGEHRMRPAMLLAGGSVADVRALIDRGIAADFTYPAGTAYLARTSDAMRNVRAAGFAKTVEILGRAFRLQQIDGELRQRDDVMAYFTGLVQVRGLETLRFLPGAAADHLTSTGGKLTDSDQMSALQWLEAGATGSYGTVSEPCNFPQKFPHPGIFLLHYLNGDTLIEAYWKSVAWPTEGVFIGEPLARPFGARVRMGRERWVLEAFSPIAGPTYVVRNKDAVKPEHRVIALKPGRNLVQLPHLDREIVIEPHAGSRAPTLQHGLERPANAAP